VLPPDPAPLPEAPPAPDVVEVEPPIVDVELVALPAAPEVDVDPLVPPPFVDSPHEAQTKPTSGKAMPSVLRMRPPLENNGGI
jgi:hypothetical protein